MRTSSEPPVSNRPLQHLEPSAHDVSKVGSPPTLTDTKRPKVLESFATFGDQQLNILHAPDRHLISACMDSEELNEYQEITATMVREVSENLQRISDQLSWTAEQARWTIPGPFLESRNFYFDLIIGEVIFAQSDEILSEEDLRDYWPMLRAADRSGSRSFVDNACFKAVHHNCNNMDCASVIDAVWVRRWKKVFENDNITYVIKSRLCGRGVDTMPVLSLSSRV